MAELKSFYLHLASDSTGETVGAMARAACARFDGIAALERMHVLIRTRGQVDEALKKVEAEPGIVLFTMVDGELRDRLEEGCRRLGAPCLSALDPVVELLRVRLDARLSGKLGGQHALDRAYFARMAAIDFAMAHDDGQSPETLDEADVILAGVSRTTKTPTCMYLANRGYKAANVPLATGVEPPLGLVEMQRVPVVGLTVSPDRLAAVRRRRLAGLGASGAGGYARLEAVGEEEAAARLLFRRCGWPTVDVTDRSVEEVAAAVIALLERRGEGEGESR